MNLHENNIASNTDNNTTNKLTKVLFVIYLGALFWILILKLGVRFSYMAERRVNLIPFSEPLILNGKTDFWEMILNAIVFLPLGIYAGILFNRWNLGKNSIFFFLVSLLFEGVQFILRIGAFDITDIITNTLGGMIGLMLFKALVEILKSSIKAQKIINIIATISTVLMVTLLLLLKMNMLPIRYQ